MRLKTAGGLLVLLLCLADTVCAERAATRALRVLLVGNSYTRYHNLAQVLSAMAASARPGLRLEVAQSAFDSYTLERHWQEGQSIRVIRDGQWDLVVLQGHSMQPVRNPIQLSSFAQKLDAEIKKIGAHTVFFMTWAHRDKPEMLTRVAQTYNTIAAELHANVAPVGLAWQRALQERPGLALHAPDHSHPSPTGTYLTACVLYATLTGHNPLGLSTGGLPQVARAESHFLQRIAWETVTQYRQGTTRPRSTPTTVVRPVAVTAAE